MMQFWSLDFFLGGGGVVLSSHSPTRDDFIDWSSSMASDGIFHRKLA